MLINTLPKWALTNTSPSFYETESGTVIEQTAKMYAKMNELVDAFNKYTNDVNTIIEEFEKSTTDDIELFKTGLRQEFQDFIDVIDLKILELNNLSVDLINQVDVKFAEQDLKIQNAETYMKSNLESVSEDIIDLKIASEELYVAIKVDEGAEEMIIVGSNYEDSNSIIYTSSEERIDIV